MPEAPPEPVYVLRGHRAAVQCVSFLPNCKGLAAGDAEGELKLWDLDSRRPTASIRAHERTSGILQVACPASHPWVVSQGRDGVVKCWELHSGSTLSSAPVRQLTTGSYNFCRFAVLEAGQTSSSCCRTQVVTAATQPTGRDNSTQQHSTPTHPVVDGFCAAATESRTTTAAAAAAAPVDGGRGNTRSSSSSGRGVSTAPVQQQVPRQQQPNAAGLLTQELQQQQQQQQQQVVICERFTALAVGQQDQHAAVTTTAAIAAVATAELVIPEGDDLTEADEEQLMCRTTAAATNNSNSSSSSRSACATGPPGSSKAVKSAPLSSSTSSTAAAAVGPCFIALPMEDPASLGIWQLGGSDPSQTGITSGAAAGGGVSRALMQLQQSKRPDQPHRGQCMAVVLLQPQGQALHVLTGYEDGSVALWDSRNCSTYLAAQKLHSEPVMCLAAAADCCSGFSGSADDRVASFDVDIPRGYLKAGPYNTLPQQGLADVAIRPDGRIAATAGWDAKVRVWHGKKRQALAIVRWHSQQVACVGFSSDSVLLAAGGRDNAISLWSLYPPRGASSHNGV